MSYFQPYVDASGFHIPSYQDILDDEVAQFLAIYPTNTYLGIDSSDYQAISVRSLKISDAFRAAQLAYNQRSPLTAVGSGLDAVVKYAGIARKAASSSTVGLQISGTPGAVFVNAIASDASGQQWILPATVTVPSTGQILVTATAALPGAVTAGPNTVTIRSTPQSGWNSVTNPSGAVAGQPIETDSQLRARFSIAAATPSRTLFNGTVAAVQALPGVTRTNIIENPTGAVDANGTPAHSITCVVEGGSPTAIAQAIYQNKSIGAYANGSTEVDVLDANNNGQVVPIRFSRPTYQGIWVTVTVHPLDPSFTQVSLGTTYQIAAAIIAYLNSLAIGETVSLSLLQYAAMSIMPNTARPQFSIQTLIAGLSSGTQGSADIPMTFSQVALGVTGQVQVTVV